jgi:alpha-beta hydrolase superfamily lysophospholipase
MSTDNNQSSLPAQMIPVADAAGHTTEIATIWRAPSAPERPTVMWLSGFKSDMRGTKASALADWSAWHGYGFLALDYSGHGESAGRFEDGTIGDWLAQTRAVLEWADPAKVIVVGSSMGGWIALLLMRLLLRDAPERAARVAGLALIAPAWNMTELIWNELPQEARAQVEREGQFMRPSDYDPQGYPITRRLIEEGKAHLVPPGTPIDPGAPVRILQGMADPDVPWRHSLALIERLTREDAHLHLVRDAAHQLSRPQDLVLLFDAVQHLAENAAVC